ncbi:hypothetical protein CORC01_09581 [Colletotrichum orchidophilum]|uniref:Aminotransferase class-III n=1 Tax=Colletotrichum orchidophilum TaxID=1209926 RepID=A0A1G4B1C1_9PEZI|nr:uncharacterized protein CORC01_09581 [Colletotrichum orchidophilum]OHE95194.1 hypothetical protein CORC01_09581 [Colletotrichum orchidophilum]
MANPLWREFINNRMALERRYGQILHLYEETFANYFGGYVPIHYGTSNHSTMNPETTVQIILTLAELSLSEYSESSESPFTDEDDTLKRMGWEDVHAKKPCWALLSDTYAATTVSSKSASGKSSLKFSGSPNFYGRDPFLLHIDGVSDEELRDQLYIAKEKGCIGIIVEIVETQYNGRVLDRSVLKRLSVMCAEEQFLLAVDESLTAIRCGAPFSFQREEYFDVASPDLVFFGKATGAQGVAISFDGQFVKRFGLSGSSRGRAIRKWQSNFHKPLPTADLIQAMTTIDIAIQGNFMMLSRIIGQAVRNFILEQALERGHEVTAQGVLGGLESLIFRSTSRSVKDKSSGVVSLMVNIFRGGLFSPPTLTYDPLLLLLNHEDKSERNKLTEKWKDNKLQELNFVGVVAALLANVLTSTGSWPNLLPPETTTPWPVRTCWFCGIAFALASVLTAADQTIRLHRMAGHRDGLVLIRQSLRSQDRVLIGTEWKYRPRKMQVYAWQLSVLFLAGAVLCMISGMIFLVWSAVAEDIGRGKGFDDNGKVGNTALFLGVALISIRWL